MPRPNNRGMSKTREYAIFIGMWQRCTNPKDPSYGNYGGRGITVAPEWREFQNFFRDMGIRPSTKHSLDRIDNSKGYSKENCRWATQREQMNNTRDNTVYEYLGRSQTLAEWSRETGIQRGTIHARIEIMGWTLDRAFTTPVREVRKDVSRTPEKDEKTRQLASRGLTKIEISRIVGLTRNAVAAILKGHQ